MDFKTLVQSITDIHRKAQASTAKAVNAGLTLRNWLIGAYIHEYELQGQDRAEYGEMLMARLAEALRGQKVPACERPRLYAYLGFFRAYPQMAEVVPTYLAEAPSGISANIFRSLTGKSPAGEDKPQIVRSATGITPLSGQLLLDRLSYTHLELLAVMDDPLKRAFYEVECIKGSWSVRELKRQITSLYYERSGLSLDKTRLSAMANETAIRAEPGHIIRDPYVFEFLGLRPQEVLPESDLEAALIDKLQAFLLELGHGFCFEARQKRLLIGGEHFFVDLVFYHRILKCHVLIELKVDCFRHEHLGQLNTYVTWFREHEMAESDNPPVGLLLCTDKNHALVKYALAGMDNRLFVSKYELELPDEARIRAFLEEQYRQLQGGQAQ